VGGARFAGKSVAVAPDERLRRVRFRLFLLLRLVSQPAYYYYGLGDEVQLSVEIIPVRVR